MIISLFFPIWVRFQGKDAITTSSIFIIIVFICYIVRALLTRSLRGDFVMIIAAFIVIGCLSSISVPQLYWGPSIRGYTQFVCALLGFFMVVNYYQGLEEPQRYAYIHQLLILIIVMFLVQVMIGCILYFRPSFGGLLHIFATRTEDVVATRIELGIKRLRGLIVAQETFGEILAMLAPMVLYMIARKKWVYTMVYGIFAIGVVLTATRTSILLFAVNTLFYFILNVKRIKFAVWMIFIMSAILVSMLYVFYFPHAADVIWGRFSEFINLYKSTGSVVAAMGRKEIWEIGAAEIFARLNLTGHGMITIINGMQFNLHNLYLTLLFQLGILGLILYLLVLARISSALVVSIFREHDENALMLKYACLLSFSTFVLSEIKCEFNRGSSYQQVIWLLLGIYYLLARTLRRRNI